MTKKIILFLIFLFGFGINQGFADSIIYTNSSDGYKLYKKDASDNLYGIAITTTGALYPTLSPDNQYIVYVNKINGTLYKKNANDTSNGTQISTVVSSVNPIYSPDGLYIYYNGGSPLRVYKKNANDTSNGNTINSSTVYSQSNISVSMDGLYILYSSTSAIIYKKNANDTSNGSVYINASTSGSHHRISPDGLYVYYNDNSLLYKKNYGDTGVGSAITSGNVTFFNLYNSGANIVYVNASNQLYIKNANDTSNGTQLLSGNVYPSTPIYLADGPTCTDGVQNQGETGIDVGGPCGTNSFNYTGNYFSGSNIVCSTKQYLDPNQTTTRFTDFGDMTPFPFGDGLGATTGPLALNWNGDIGYQDFTGIGLDTDYFRGIYFGTDSYLPHEVMKFNSGTGANVGYQSSRTSSLSPTNPRIRILRKRGGELSNFNTIQCSGRAGNGGCDYATLGDYINGIAVEKISKFDQKVCALDSAGSSTCTILFNQTGNYSDLTITSGFTGMRFGNIGTGTINKVECSNDSYSCRWDNYGTGFFCNGHTNYNPESGTIVGECSIDSNGYCGPTENFRSPGFGEENILDGSGKIIGIGPAGKVTGKAVVEDIFSCPEYKTWTDGPACVLTVIKNLYNGLKDGLGIVSESSTTGPRKIINQMGSGGSDFSRNFNTGATRDQKIINGAWNTGFDSSNPFSKFFIASLISVVFIAIITIIILITLITSNKK